MHVTRENVVCLQHRMQQTLKCASLTVDLTCSFRMFCVSISGGRRQCVSWEKSWSLSRAERLSLSSVFRCHHTSPSTAQWCYQLQILVTCSFRHWCQVTVSDYSTRPLQMTDVGSQVTDSSCGCQLDIADWNNYTAIQCHAKILIELIIYNTFRQQQIYKYD